MKGSIRPLFELLIKKALNSTIFQYFGLLDFLTTFWVHTAMPLHIAATAMYHPLCSILASGCYTHRYRNFDPWPELLSSFPSQVVWFVLVSVGRNFPLTSPKIKINNKEKLLFTMWPLRDKLPSSATGTSRCSNSFFLFFYRKSLSIQM